MTFEREGHRLEGTLSLPARRHGRAVPGVLIVHGSGPMSRDGFMPGQLGLGFGFELPVYRLLARTLVEHGFAVYRYDKRSCTRYNGCGVNAYPEVPRALVSTELTVTSLLADAVAAVKAMEERPEIDDASVFVVGHSQGGQLVPALLRELPEVRAGVMLAPPFHTVDVLVEQQSRRVEWAFAGAGKPVGARRERELLATAAQQVRRLALDLDFGEPILGQPAAIWISWLAASRQAPGIAAELERPLLVLGGTYDYNVEPEEIRAWAAWLAARDVGHRVRLLECVTHALNCITQPDPRLLRPEDIGHVLAPEVEGEMIAFLARNLVP